MRIKNNNKKTKMLQKLGFQTKKHSEESTNNQIKSSQIEFTNFH